ncbi:MAG: MarR family transcriptional regulator [Methanospirillum sp.]|uniref:MarR family winged helix-turn-helix transcriptional regulator n=1 Tax=Methanospirillum sp. TaxID=45200 RepID=UPI002369B530|nr:MarR family transcriptional regulator [Methanospirillum sp.]MDD1730074.1 MarR family transcriptional regulator [Methanospirillum sp.]
MKGNAVARMSRALDLANRFIISELESRGISDLAPSHGDIFFLLFHCDRLPMQEIACKIHRTKPTVTILVKKLVELGYVEREKSQEDSRVTYISLTEEGRKLRPIFEEISKLLNEKVYGGFSPGQAILFEEMLENVYDRFAQGKDGDENQESDEYPLPG